MKRQFITMFLSIILLTACSTTQESNTPTSTPNTNENPTAVDVPKPALSDSSQKETTESSINKIEENAVEKDAQRKRKGNINVDDIQVVGVKGELLKTIMQIIDTLNNNDERGRKQFMYDPLNFDELQGDGPYILAITKLELDNSRRDACIRRI